MRRPTALHILATLRRDMANYIKTRPLVKLAQEVGLSQSICWRILHEERAASFDNVEKLLVYFGYRLVKDEAADQSHQSEPGRSTTRRAGAGKPTKTAKPRRPRKV